MSDLFERMQANPQWQLGMSMIAGENPDVGLKRAKAQQDYMAQQRLKEVMPDAIAGNLDMATISEIAKSDPNMAFKLADMKRKRDQATQRNEMMNQLMSGGSSGSGGDLAPYLLSTSEDPIQQALGQKMLADLEQERKISDEERKIEQQIDKEKRAPNQTQSASYAFGERMVNAEGNLSDGKDALLASGIEAVARRGPAGNYMVSEDYQLAYQAAQDWVTANLRKESGAAIPPEEMANEIRKYFPIPGDSDKVIEQKRKSRATAMKGMRKSAGALGEDLPEYPLFGAQEKSGGFTREQLLQERERRRRERSFEGAV